MTRPTADDIHKNHLAQEKNIETMSRQIDEIIFPLQHPECAAYRFSVDSLAYLEPFLGGGRTWLTVGDYNGFESSYLHRVKGERVTATDLSDAILKEVHRRGFIPDYSKQNVERMTYEDDAFDYVLCKQSFHHFPRAYLGLYEMIRVSRIAVVMIAEPIDILSRMASIVFVKNVLDRIDPLLINRLWKNRFSFESVGNYVFKVSEREMEKVAMGIGLPCIAFKRHNTFVTHERMEGLMDDPPNRKLLSRVQRSLAIKNFLSAVGLIPYNSIGTILFKVPPEESVVRAMKAMGYVILPLPKNPYLQ